MNIKDLKAKYMPVTHYPPQCCASCEWLTDEGHCQQYDQPVPSEYLEQENECAGYLPRVPF